MARSSALNRRISYYPRPKNEALVKSYAEQHDMSRSELLDTAVTRFFDNLPTTERERLLNKFSNKSKTP